MIVMVSSVFVMPVMAALIPVSITVAIMIAPVSSAVIAIAVTISVFCKRQPAEDHRQDQKNYQT